MGSTRVSLNTAAFAGMLDRTARALAPSGTKSSLSKPLELARTQTLLARTQLHPPGTAPFKYGHPASTARAKQDFVSSTRRVPEHDGGSHYSDAIRTYAVRTIDNLGFENGFRPVSTAVQRAPVKPVVPKINI